MPPQYMPTPYEVKDAITPNSIYIETVSMKPDGGFICDMQADATDTPKERKRLDATAAFIVRACNAHDDLLRVCEAVMVAPGLEHLSIVSITDMLQAAIDKAKEGT